jgi:predicted alpha/beta hydrolase
VRRSKPTRTHTHARNAWATAQVIWNYISDFFKRDWTLRQRLEAASFVLHFLRVWRSWLLHHDTYTLGTHFVSRECYEDITISVHQVALLIK